jgi:O-antigen/teichoic acid export membrane protein
MLADDIITTIYGAEYINAAGALKILVWSTAIIFIGTVQTHTTRASHREGFTAAIVASSAVLNVVLNFILIPKYSYYGAALATLASELFTFITHYRYMAKNLVKPPLFRLAVKVVLTNLVMCAYLLVTVKLNLYFAAFSAVLVNLLMLRVIGYFTKNEFTFMLDALKLSRSPAT